MTNRCFSWFTLMTWFRLNAFDLSALESLKILDYSKGVARIIAKDKWELVEDFLLSTPFLKELCKKCVNDTDRE